MKSIKQIRESYDLITEKEETEDRKLATLVRAGLYDAKKLPALKKALDKSVDKMTAQEKRMLITLLDSLINQVVSNDQVYRKVRQNVHQMNESKEKGNFYSRTDPRFKKGYPSDKQMPTVLILKRKAIRVYPDDQKVALYYSQALDKYVTIPFTDIQTGINEENLDENVINLISKGYQIGSKLAPGAIAKAKKLIPSAKKVKDVAAGAATSALTRAKRMKDWGKRAYQKWKNRRRNRRDTDIDLSLGGGGGQANQNQINTTLDTSKRTYGFDKKPTSKSAFQTARSTNTQTQERRYQQANLRAMSESVIKKLEKMVQENIQQETISFNEQEININNTVAKKIMYVYESVNTTNKKKMEKMLNESAESFNKVLTFATRQ